MRETEAEARLNVILGFILAATFSQTPASAQPAPPPPCAGPEYLQMDFWVGTWDLEYDQPDGSVGTAVNIITRDDIGDCAITEAFSMPNGYRGRSWSTFDPNVGQWRQMWIDNQGGTFTLVGGPVAGEDHIFELKTVNPVGAGRTLHRMIWEDVTPGSLVWRWQAATEDGGWVDRWVLRYRRRAPSRTVG